MAWLILAAALVGSYLLGSVSGAVVISELIGHKDVRNEGSGNAGMTNMLRVMGIGPGILTFLIDILKGVLPCLAAKYLIFPAVYEMTGLSFLRPEYAVYYVGFCCLAGHIYPLYFGFKGGKGVSTTLGVGLVCCPYVALCALGVFIVVFAFTRIVSLSSITAAALLPFLNIIFAVRLEGAPYAVLIQCLLTAVLSLNIIVSHRSNIGRLIRGEEKKLTVKKNKESR